MAEHTPTPWGHRPLPSDDCVIEIYGSDGELVLGEETNYAFNHPVDELHAFNCVNSHDALVKALEEIAYPIRAMQSRLLPGEKLNGVAAVALADSAEFLRSIALKALAAFPTGEAG